MNVYKYINKVMIGTNVNITDIPEELKNVPHVSVDDTSALFTQALISESENEKFLFIITNQNNAVQFIKAYNNFSEHKIGYAFNGECDISAIEKAIESSCVTDNNGNRYFPEPSGLTDIFHDESRILIKNVNHIEHIPDCEEIFYKNKDDKFGIVLSEQYLYEETSVESADHCIADISLKEKAQLMNTMITTDVYDFSSIYIIRNKNKTLFVPFNNSRKVKDIDFSDSYLKLFLGTYASTPGEAVIALSNSNLPATVIEDLNSILVNRFTDSPCTISKELVIYSMKRLLI